MPLVGYHIPKEILASAASTVVSADDPFFSQTRRQGGPLCSEDSQNDPRLATPLGRLIRTGPCWCSPSTGRRS